MSVSDEPAPPVPFGLRGGGPGRRPQRLSGGGEGAAQRAARPSPGGPAPPPDAVFEGPCAVPSLPVRPAGAGKRHSMFFVESAHSLLVLICREGRRYECRKAASFAGPTADGVPAGAGVSFARRTGNRAGSAGRSSPPEIFFRQCGCGTDRCRPGGCRSGK